MSSDDIAFASLVVAILALGIALLSMALQYYDYWNRQKEKEPWVSVDKFEEDLETPYKSHWTIRVRANRQIDRCRVTFDGVSLKTNNGQETVLLNKGGADNFRIPRDHPISSKGQAIILNGDEMIKKLGWGEIPQNKP